ncbi:MAG TPA: P27 family phage terminase small subunit [Terriglobales bacterium]|nr:P27 family phage terminase small subunit [Terriglobales bacterium]
MGKRGPQPNPLSGRTARGLNSLKGRRTLPNRFPNLGPATMPGFLSPEAVKFWKMYAPELEKRKLLDELSAPLFAGLAEQVATVRALEEILRRDGILIPGRGGRQVRHPAFAELLASQRLCLSLMKEFQMTPASRSRAGIPADADPEEDEFFKLMDGGKDKDKGDK